MRICLTNRTALLAGDGGALAVEIAAALNAAGATVMHETPSTPPLDLLVTFSQRGALNPESLERICRSAVALMRAGGCVLNVVSVTGLVPIRGDDSAPTQAAAIALSRGLALDAGPLGIRVNALAVVPGDAVQTRMATHTPGGRSPAPDSVAHAALFLLDPDNTYTTGHVLVADGGWSIGYGRDF